MKALAISSMLLLAVACQHEQLATPSVHVAQSQESSMPGSGESGSADRQQEITWVHGKVSDEQGRPIANATVYALATHLYGHREAEIAKQVATDQRGDYELKGLGSYIFFSLTVVATAPGRAPAWAWPEVEMHRDWESNSSHAERRAAPVEDFVLSSRSGKLDVTVLLEGKPVKETTVDVYLKNAPLRKRWAVSSPDRDAIENAAHPSAITDADGVAHFDHLLPGSYRVIAILGRKRDIHYETRPPAAVVQAPYAHQFPQAALVQAPYAFADGIAVQTGETTKFKLAIYPQEMWPPFIIHRADGTPLIGNNTASNIGPVDSSKGSGHLALDRSGKGEAWVEHPGLWRVEANYRSSPTKSIPTQHRYYAIGEVAASPSLAVTATPIITAGRFKKNASVNVQVLDEHGKPLRAKVQINHLVWALSYSGSTDNQGRIRFARVTPSDRYVIRASSDGTKPLFHFGKTFSPAANVSRLANRLEILPQYLTVADNQEVNVVLKRELAGYLYGTVKLPAGQDDLRHVRIVGPAQFPDMYYPVFESGEYFAGPFRAGVVEAWFGNHKPYYPQGWVEIRTTIQPGEAKRVNIEQADWKLFRPLTHTGYILTINGDTGSVQIWGPANLTGTVTMHDGRTPALGAQVFYFEPGQADPTIVAMADAAGNLHSRTVDPHEDPDEVAQPVGEKVAPDSPVLIALLPGMCGATIQPVTKIGDAPLHLVLPQPLSLSGNVAVDRSALRLGAGSIRVVAAYQGEPFLARWLSMEAHADADGNFALKGLSPGTYQIQAALDEIWLSAPVTVTISDRDPEPVHLAITAPGAALRILLRGGDNKPIAGAAIAIDHEGPLSGLWPHEWVSDGAGVVFVPTLESGKHTIRGKRLPKPEEIEVPPLRTATPVDLVLTLR